MAKRPVSFVTNPTETEPWLEPIGKLITNFGAIELHTYWWVAALSGSVEKSRAMLRSRIQFGKRADFVLKLLDDPMWESIRDQAHPIWIQAKEMAKFRNSFAHNPLAFFAPKDDKLEPWAGIPDVARLREPKETRDRLATLEELNIKISEIYELAIKLFDVLEKVDRIRGHA